MTGLKALVLSLNEAKETKPRKQKLGSESNPIEIEKADELTKLKKPLTFSSQGDENLYFTDSLGNYYYSKTLKADDLNESASITEASASLEKAKGFITEAKGKLGEAEDIVKPLLSKNEGYKTGFDQPLGEADLLLSGIRRYLTRVTLEESAPSTPKRESLKKAQATVYEAMDKVAEALETGKEFSSYAKYEDDFKSHIDDAMTSLMKAKKYLRTAIQAVAESTEAEPTISEAARPMSRNEKMIEYEKYENEVQPPEAPAMKNLKKPLVIAKKEGLAVTYSPKNEVFFKDADGKLYRTSSYTEKMVLSFNDTDGVISRTLRWESLDKGEVNRDGIEGEVI